MMPLSVAERHGLIEAKVNYLCAPQHAPLSVAERHGLIEADEMPPGLALAVFVIRGRTPRPH